MNPQATSRTTVLQPNVNLPLRVGLSAINPRTEKDYAKTLYHVSPESNHVSIMTRGVDPLFARGKRRASYWVEHGALFWAMSHVSGKFNVPVSHIMVYEWQDAVDHMVKFRGKVWWTGTLVEHGKLRPIQASAFVAVHLYGKKP